MFCTFLSPPSEELNFDVREGTESVGCETFLSFLHCMVLPQDELFPSLSDSNCSVEQTCDLLDRMLLQVRMTTYREGEESGCVWDRVKRRCNRTVSPSQSKTPKSPLSKIVKGNQYIRVEINLIPLTRSPGLCNGLGLNFFYCSHVVMSQWVIKSKLYV